MIQVKVFPFNPLQVNTVVLFDETRECVIIDAACMNKTEQDWLVSFIEEHQLKPVRLLNTHGHFDHIMGVSFLKKKYELSFEAHAADQSIIDGAMSHAGKYGIQIDECPEIDQALEEGQVIRFGNSELTVIHTPGHTPGGIVFYAEKDKIAVAGDTLFYGSIGRTDFPLGSYDAIIHSIKTKLMVLPGDVKVYTGHGPATTIAFEQANNPFIQ